MAIFVILDAGGYRYHHITHPFQLTTICIKPMDIDRFYAIHSDMHSFISRDLERSR